MALVTGEAGIGKSRLTAALMERLAIESHTRLRYFCSPQHTASALYSEARDTVALQMLTELKKSVESRGILVENVLLRDIGLPATLKAAIEAKQQAEQDAQRMNFVLQKERQEAERKRIEAQGISDFQRIVTLGISQQLLDWKGIEATMEIAKSPNAKVVVIGNTKNGLPVIFSGQ